MSWDNEIIGLDVWGIPPKRKEKDPPENPKEKVTVTEDIEYAEVHSDAGRHGQRIKCPNCNEEVVFADGQWWRSECSCGEWELVQEARLIEDDYL